MIFSLKRLFAYWLDCVMMMLFLVVPQWLVYRLTDGFPFELFKTGLQIEIWVLLTISLPVWLYFIIFERFYQKTLGKMLMGMKVTNTKGERISLKQAVLRTFWRLLPWELTHIILLFPEPMWSVESPPAFRTFFLYAVNVLLLLYIMFLAFTRGKKAMHDVFFGTLVTK